LAILAARQPLPGELSFSLWAWGRQQWRAFLFAAFICSLGFHGASANTPDTITKVIKPVGLFNA